MTRSIECRLAPAVTASFRAGPGAAGGVLVAHPELIRGPRRDVLLVRELAEWSSGAAAVETCASPRFTLSRARGRVDALHLVAAARAVRNVPSDSHPLEVEAVCQGDGSIVVRAWRGRDAAEGVVRLVDASGRPLAAVATSAAHEALPRTATWASGEARDRLSWTRVAIVGCGRAGGLVADALLAQGLRSFVLIDADALEAGNLDGSTLVSRADIGRPKVAAVAEAILRRRPDAEVTRVVAWAEDPESLLAMAEAHVVVTCVDRAEPRWVVNAAARRFCQFHVDFGAGRLAGRWAVDVRTLPPGSACLTCLGGTAEAQSRQRPTHVVNATGAARVADRVVGWVLGEGVRATWDRIVFGSDGSMAVESMPRPTGVPRCGCHFLKFPDL